CLAFADVLQAEQIERVLQEEKATWREKVFTPPLTLWAFLGQVISPDGSCRKAVARVMAWLVSRGEPPCRPETDPYCKARQRLPDRDALVAKVVGAFSVIQADDVEAICRHGNEVNDPPEFDEAHLDAE